MSARSLSRELKAEGLSFVEAEDRRVLLFDAKKGPPRRAAG
jgi:hypothetical protein